jgi:hypothetical protein
MLFLLPIVLAVVSLTPYLLVTWYNLKREQLFRTICQKYQFTTVDDPKCLTALRDTIPVRTVHGRINQRDVIISDCYDDANPKWLRPKFLEQPLFVFRYCALPYYTTGAITKIIVDGRQQKVDLRVNPLISFLPRKTIFSF